MREREKGSEGLRGGILLLGVPNILLALLRLRFLKFRRRFARFPFFVFSKIRKSHQNDPSVKPP